MHFETVVDLAAAAVREAKHAISEAHAVIEEALSEAEDEDEAEEERRGTRRIRSA